MRPNRQITEKASDLEDPRDADVSEAETLATRSTLPLVTQRRPGRDGLALFAGIVFVGIIGATTLIGLDASRHAQPVPNGTRGAAPNLRAGADVPPPVPAAAITPLPGQGAQTPIPGAVNAAPMQPAVVATNPYASPAIVFDASDLPAVAPATPAVAMGAAGNTSEDFAARVGGVGGGTAVATAGMNPKTTVTQGTLIPAVLETAIDTDVPGFVRAIVSADVRSFDGTRILIPRSSRLIGQYRSGLQAGQKRAYVIWTRLIRPDGASVNIGSPAVGFSGETGLAGKVNTRFFERFGSAMLLSVVGGLSAIGGNAGVVIASGGQSAAAAAVGQTAQISPTVRVRQGEPIRVFTARDLDFSKVTPE
jgi:type IV secretion system protein VirB10